MEPTINIRTILESCQEPFVVVKKDGDRYAYDIGNDIDIFAKNATALTKEILNVCVSKKIVSESQIRITITEEHTHIDFMDGDTLIVRIDIIDTLDIFKNVLLFNDNHYAQLAFRLFELAVNPHKTKHLEFVKNELNRTTDD